LKKGDNVFRYYNEEKPLAHANPRDFQFERLRMADFWRLSLFNDAVMRGKVQTVAPQDAIFSYFTAGMEVCKDFYTWISSTEALILLLLWFSDEILFLDLARIDGGRY
tara:strand:- start:284 stop:607 length:324 start_codon:yes stop_codon:yes gene_type:complete